MIVIKNAVTDGTVKIRWRREAAREAFRLPKGPITIERSSDKDRANECPK
jgi:hypothetical protein